MYSDNFYLIHSGIFLKMSLFQLRIKNSVF